MKSQSHPDGLTMQSEAFRQERAAQIEKNAADLKLLNTARDFVVESIRARYSYNFDWLGRPIIQYPQDMVAIQELLWQVKPDLVIETGIAHGGSVIMTASMLALLDYCDAVQEGRILDPSAPYRRVLAVDIDIRPHNRAAIEAHPLAHRIEMIEGSSIATEVISRVKARAKDFSRIFVCLDSNHTHDHVLAELKAYATLVSQGSYCVVFDTIIDRMPEGSFVDRPWGPGNSPLTAVAHFLSRLKTDHVVAHDGERLDFLVDEEIDHRLLISAAPHGYLRRTRSATG